MYDTIGKIACPDCNSVIVISFTLLVYGAPTLVSLAACGRCADKRTIRASGSMTRESYIWASDHGLPMVRFS